MNEGKLILTCQPFLQNHGATPKNYNKNNHGLIRCKRQYVKIALVTDL